MEPRKINPSPEYLHGLFRYDAESGLVFWERDGSRWQKLLGRRAGCVCPSTGYRVIRFDGATYKESRIIWAMQTGAWPIKNIDHINNCRDDNRWVNLREATFSENRQNTAGKHAGLKGVSRCHNKYRARIKVAGKTKHLGTFEAPSDAAKAYLTAAKIEYGDFARI